MYIKFNEYTGQALSDEDSVLMSLAEFQGGGKDLLNVAITVTNDGSEPVEEQEDYVEEFGVTE